MENVMQELKAIMQDVKEVNARVSEYTKEIDRGINVNHTDESVIKQDKINNLFYCLDDARFNMDRVQESLKDIHEKLDVLLDVVEYENIAKEIR